MTPDAPDTRPTPVADAPHSPPPKSRSAYVVVDTGTVRRAADTTQLVAIDPARLAAVLSTLGLIVRDVTIVSPDVPLPGTSDETIEALDKAAHAQLGLLADSDVPARSVSAFASDPADPGQPPREVGVDGLLVVAALQYAREIADGRRPDGVVILITDDPDAWIAHRYPTGVPIVYAASLDAGSRAAISQTGGRWLDLSTPTLATLLAGDLRSAESSTYSDSAFARLSTSETERQERAAARWGGAKGHGSVAIVDLADLFRRSIAVVGAAELPGPPEVRRLLRRLHAPEPAATYAVAPDIPDHLLPAPNEPASIGWRVTDARFAQAVSAYTDDQDDSSHAGVGELFIERGIDGTYRVSEQRRLATAVVADTWWAATQHPHATVAVLSDRWDVVALQWQGVDFDVACPQRITRVGTEPKTVAGLDLTTVVLPDSLLAELMGVPARHRAVALSDRSGEWRIEGVSLPERAVTLTSVATAGSGKITFPSFSERLEALNRVAGLEPSRAAHEVMPARVTGYREPDTVVLESPDGDSITVSTIGERPPIPGQYVALLSDKYGRRWFVAQPGQADLADSPELQIIEVTASGDALTARAIGDEEQLPLAVLPGCQLEPGDRLLALRGDGRWRALSSRLTFLGQPDR